MTDKMQLLLDIGNTRIKWALVDRAEIIVDGAVQSNPVDLAQLSLQLRSYNVSAACACCVNSDGTLAAVQDWLRQQYALEAVVIGVRRKAGKISNGYQQISTLGVDRWVAAVGARKLLSEGDLIIVDVGTATTIDWLDVDDVFQGGSILPGLALMRDSLVSGTAHIESSDIDSAQIIGKTTAECVNSGLSYGAVGAVERIVEEMQTLIGRKARMVLTGGGAEALTSKLRLEVLHEPQLVLLGLLQLSPETINQ
jgi:type III pantothenate kinase